MWVIYQKADRKIVGVSAHSVPDLEKEFALKEVVRGLANPGSLENYDAIQISDLAQMAASMAVPLERAVLREIHPGKLELAVEEPKISLLRIRTDASDLHPVDGIPEIKADGTSFATITVQKVNESGEPMLGEDDNDPLYLRTDYGSLWSTDGREEITTVRLERGQASFRLVAERARRVATVQVFNADLKVRDNNIRIEFV